MSPSGLVRPAYAQDATVISRSMTSAFYNDPGFVWCIPDSAARKEQLPAFFRIVFDALVGFGQCYSTADSAAASMWVPPGLEPLTGEQSDSLRGVFDSVDAVAAARFTALIELMASYHPAQDHFYLWLLGVSTPGQNRGLGSSLLRSGLDLCDERSLPAYLEATTDRNRRLYERHGFHVTGELTANGSPPMWAMWREPLNRAPTRSTRQE
jgi:ribosomal protein S18 acetylase RimI-like enzyme